MNKVLILKFVDTLVCWKKKSGPDLGVWQRISDIVAKPEGSVKIAIVGKYTSLLDSYKSLAEALTHGGIANKIKVELVWMNSEIFESEDTVQHWKGSMVF